MGKPIAGAGFAVGIALFAVTNLAGRCKHVCANYVGRSKAPPGSALETAPRRGRRPPGFKRCFQLGSLHPYTTGGAPTLASLEKDSIALDAARAEGGAG